MRSNAFQFHHPLLGIGTIVEERRSKMAALLQNMKKECAELNKLLKDEEKDELALAGAKIMEHQIEIYYKKYSQLNQHKDVLENQEEDEDAHAIEDNSEVFQSEEPTMNKNSIDDVLKLPEKYKRKTNRVYKQKNFGVMTSTEILDTHRKEVEKLKQEEAAKEQKKQDREEKKKMREKIMKMKKEKSEESAKPVKKRGRPKKAVV